MPGVHLRIPQTHAAVELARKQAASGRSRGSSAANLKEQLDQRTRERDEAREQLAEADLLFFCGEPLASHDPPTSSRFIETRSF